MLKHLVWFYEEEDVVDAGETLVEVKTIRFHILMHILWVVWMEIQTRYYSRSSLTEKEKKRKINSLGHDEFFRLPC